MKLNDIEWKTFDFEEVFCFQRGQRYKRADHIKGDYYYISSTAFINGIDNYVGPTEKNKPFKNVIGLNNSGSVGHAFYQEKAAIFSDHVTLIWLKDRNLTRKIALFLIPLIENIKYKYSFGREISDTRLAKEKIALPVASKRVPNWEFMETYIQDKAKLITFKKDKDTPENNDGLVSLTDREWKVFNIFELFKVSSGKYYTKKEYGTGTIPYVTTKNEDNGITALTSLTPANQGNIITIGKVGMVNKYHEHPVALSADVVQLEHDRLNIMNGLFIKTILDQEKYKWNYGRQFRQKGTKITEIPLPVLIGSNEKPDWSFMELYIKQLSKTLIY